MSPSYMNMMKQTMELYRNQAFTEAYHVLTQHGDAFPAHASMTLYLRSCLAARIDQPQLAINLLREAVDRGYWYGEHVMRESPSWQALQGVPAFEQLAAVCKVRQTQAQAATQSQCFVLEPEQGCGTHHPCPLLITLHGNGDNAANALDAWHPAIDEGWLLASIQSSQIVSTDAYVWDDQTTAIREAQHHYTQLNAEYAIDPTHVLVTGFSMGAETALRLALSKTIPAQGFILLGPGGPATAEPERWQPLLKQLTAHELRGYVLLGEEDQGIPHDTIRQLVEALNQHNVPCELEMVPNLNHEYPQAIRPYLKRALAFIYDGRSTA